MIWIAPSEKDTDNAGLEKRLWDTADQFRANSGLKAQEWARRCAKRIAQAKGFIGCSDRSSFARAGLSCVWSKKLKLARQSGS